MNDDVPGDLIGTAEAAALMGRHDATVRRDIREGRLAAWRIRGRLMVSRAAVEATAVPVRVTPTAQGGGA
jgi:excisionase family DNA binding protein